MVIGSYNEAAELVGVGSHSQQSNLLSHTGRTQTPRSVVRSLHSHMRAVKNWITALDNYTIQALTYYSSNNYS